MYRNFIENVTGVCLKHFISSLPPSLPPSLPDSLHIIRLLQRPAKLCLSLCQRLQRNRQDPGVWDEDYHLGGGVLQGARILCRLLWVLRNHFTNIITLGSHVHSKGSRCLLQLYVYLSVANLAAVLHSLYIFMSKAKHVTWIFIHHLLAT